MRVWYRFTVTVFEVLATAVAAFLAGGVNTVVGSGSLITFPTLVWLGVPPIAANVTNTLGLAPGAVMGAWGYRHELRGRSALIRRLMPAAGLGATGGVALLFILPADAFQGVVPVLVAFACLLIVFQSKLSAYVLARSRGGQHGSLVAGAVFLISVYGGYFSAAQGVLLVAVLSIFLSVHLQVVNAVKNVLQAVVNVVASVFFLFSGHVEWRSAVVIGVGSMAGAYIGARYGRLVPPVYLKTLIVLIGVSVIVFFIAS